MAGGPGGALCPRDGVRPMSQGHLFVGVDIGTSGVRAIAIDEAGAIQGQASAPMPPPEQRAGAVLQDSAIWWQATTGVLGGLCREIDGQRLAALAVDGTSGTL